MKVYRLSRYGLSNLKLVDREERPLKSSQVLVKQYATSINSADMDIIVGSLFGRFSGILKPKHKVSGSDIAGKVIKVGSGVKNLKLGDRVYGDMSEEAFGAFATHKIVREDALTLMPDEMSFKTAACLASAGVISLQAIQKKELDQSSNVCINGVGGGMGTLALQMAKNYGAHVVGIDSEYKRDKIVELGVDEYIDYKEINYTALAYKYDLIIDCQCYNPIKKFKGMLKDDGVYTMIGGSFFRIIQAALFGKSVTHGTNKEIGVLLAQMNNLSRMSLLSNLYKEKKLEAIIDKVYKFDELPKALEDFLSGKFVGKIVIEIVEEDND